MANMEQVDVKHLDEKLIEAREALAKEGPPIGRLEPGALVYEAQDLMALALDHVWSSNPEEVAFAREKLLEAAALLCEAAGEKFERRKLGPVMPMIWV